ncbi:MAG TPA: hypothetical protein VL492_04795 [Methylovirgula sp.]|nr:hypothetical protein [Methylovirgula sp.]
MKIKVFVAALSIFGLASTAFLAATPAEAGKPGGCLKYGAAGAVAGHYAHHHGVKGFIAGCTVGMIRRHEYNKQQKALKAQQKQQQMQHQAAPAPQGADEHH